MIGKVLAAVQADVSPKAWRALQRFGADGEASGRVADELGITEKFVILAKLRALKRLREETGDLLVYIDIFATDSRRKRPFTFDVSETPVNRPVAGDSPMEAAPSLHPTDQTLSSFGLGKLDDRSLEAVNQHLENCPECRKRVGEMAADSFLGRIRDAKAMNKSMFGHSMTGGESGSSGAKSPPPANTLPPGLADHPDYEIKQELGRGGMGVVYLAHNKLMGRDEVLKVMSRHLMERPGIFDRFLREIRAVATLRHPSIVTAYHATRVGDSIMFAMEYVEGLDLARMVKAKGPMRVAYACNFIYQAALGLQHAHEKGMVHRDIKPGNMMLSPKGDRATIKILDFGLAKVTREQKVDAALTSEGQALGTPDFIAPEQIVDAQSADIRADIYSLGGTLYYLLAGRPPFQADSLYDMYQAHMSRVPDALNLIRPEVPAELAALVSKMMAKEPERRFQTPAEVAQALTPFFKKGRDVIQAPRADLSQCGPSTADRPFFVTAPTPTQRATDSQGSAIRSGEQAKPSATAAPWQSLVKLSKRKATAEIAPAAAPRNRTRWFWPSVAAGCLILCFFAAWMAGLLRVKTKEGVLVIDNIPASAVVEVDGNRVTVTPTEGEPVRIEVPAGKRHVVVKRGKDELLGETVTLESGKELMLTVKRDPAPPSATNDTNGLEANQTPLAGAGMNGMADMMKQMQGGPKPTDESTAGFGMMGSMSDMMKRMQGGAPPKNESATDLEKGGMAGMRGEANREDGASTGKMGGAMAMAGMMGNRNGQSTPMGMGMMGGGGSLITDQKPDEVSPRTKAVLAKLDRRIAMKFPKRTPLREVLAYVRAATQERNEPGMPIYVDLAHVEHAEKALSSTVRFDAPNAPLKGSLDVILKQVGLAYCVKDGLLVISTPDGVDAEKGVPAAAPSDDAPRSQAIAAKLAEPLAIKFRDKTLLLDALKVIKGASIGPKNPSIQIYVNPTIYGDTHDPMMGLSRKGKPGGNAEKTKPPLVTMDVENVPLRTTLRLLLAQVGLEFSLRKGVLVINRKAETPNSMMGMMGGSSSMSGGMRGMMGGGSMMGGMGGMMSQNSDDVEPRTKAATARLDQPIAMHFAKGAPLLDVLRHLRESINVPDKPAIPIYFDPLGIGDIQKALKAMVTIDLEDIPLTNTLELLFEQVGLAHCIKDGLMFVSTPAQVSVETSTLVAPTADDEPESQAIVAELNKALPMRFPDKITLEDAVERVEDLARAKTDTPMPIVFDPPDSQDVQKAKGTAVTMDLENVPLRTTLRLLLAQAGMEFSVRKCILIITKRKESGGMMGGMMMMMGQMTRGMTVRTESDGANASPTVRGMMGGGEITPKADNAAKGTRKSKRSTSKTGKPAAVGRD